MEFPVASTKLHATADETYLFASGTYKPLVKCYDLDQLSLKFERHFDSEIIDFRVLTEDFTKLAFVCEDRSVILHAKFGHYHKTRVPKQPRCVDFDPKSADLLIGSSSPQIYRLNLDQVGGRAGSICMYAYIYIFEIHCCARRVDSWRRT